MNPTPATRYNLVVVGAGPAGLVAAIGAAGLGARVALVERGLMGGDCLNVGCVPSKALVRAGRAVAEVRRAGEFGVRVPGEPRVDFPEVMDRLRRVRAEIGQTDSARRFRDAGVDVFLGEGRFGGPDTVAVGAHTLRFAKALIATGARAAALPIPGLAEAGALTNETVFGLTKLPRRLAVIGAGPIGCELAQAFARFGAAVTMLEAAPRILPREDEAAAGCVARALARDGVAIELGCQVVRVEGARGAVQVHFRPGPAGAPANGAPSVLAADELLVAVGRAPNVERLGLEAAGVRFDPRTGIAVDDRLRTTNRRIFAAGDVCAELRFTHHADFQARVVLQNALFPGRARASALTVPWCTYTDPEIAHVGLSDAEARARGAEVRTLVQDLGEVDRAVLDGDPEGFVKIHSTPRGGRILGATIVARHASELLPELVLAMTHGIGLGQLARTVHSYPTAAEAIRRLGDAYNRTRLTPRVKALVAAWLRWTR